MKIRKARSFRFNMGNYEHAEIYVTAEIDTEVDTEFAAKTEGFIMDHIDVMLDRFIQSDLDYVLPTTDNENSWAIPYEKYRNLQ